MAKRMNRIALVCLGLGVVSVIADPNPKPRPRPRPQDPLYDDGYNYNYDDGDYGDYGYDENANDYGDNNGYGEPDAYGNKKKNFKYINFTPLLFQMTDSLLSLMLHLQLRLTTTLTR